jgi:hypothetical protein
VLLFNGVQGSVEAWAPSAAGGAMAEHLASVFHSTIPHAGIAREVFGAVDCMTSEGARA